MDVFRVRAVRFLVVLAVVYSSVTAAAAQTATSRIVTAANSFLATLDGEKRQSVLYSFDDEKQRATWSNLPTAFVPRGGISLKDMNPVQRAAAMALVSAALSPKGFEKIQQIMEGDEALKLNDNNQPGPGHNGNRLPQGPPPGAPNGPPPKNGGNRLPFGSPPNGGTMFGKALYYISILGKPSERIHGCCSLAGTIWHLTSPLLGNVVSSHRR